MKNMKQTFAIWALAGMLAGLNVVAAESSATDKPAKAAKPAEVSAPLPAGYTPGVVPLPPGYTPGSRALAPAASWKDNGWKDPDNRLAVVDYSGLPLGEIVKLLKEQFRDSFDILVPAGWTDPGDPSRSYQPDGEAITMQLRNVSASEIFNAMNLLFEAQMTPLRWQLVRNGSRQTALLQIVHELVAAPAHPPASEKPVRSIVFVGDLVNNGKPGVMPIEQIVDTLKAVYKMSYGDQPVDIKYHEGAQLLVMTGDTEQMAYLRQALSALMQKQSLARHQAKETDADSGSTTNAAKAKGASTH